MDNKTEYERLMELARKHNIICVDLATMEILPEERERFPEGRRLLSQYFLGIFSAEEDQPVIILTCQTKKSKSEVLAHELGHYVQYRRRCSCQRRVRKEQSTREREDEADRIGSRLLFFVRHATARQECFRQLRRFFKCFRLGRTNLARLSALMRVRTRTFIPQVVQVHPGF